MTTTRLRTFLPLALASLALGLSPLGCGDDSPAQGGAGGSGSGGRGGAGGSGRGGSGSGGAAGGTGGQVGGTGGVVGGAGGGGDAAAAGGAGGQDATGTDTPAAGGAGGTMVDMAVEMTPVLDAAPEADQAPDTSGSTVNVTACSQINCPALLDVASQCAANESSCTYENKMTTPNKVTNYCHQNGVKKFATTTGTGGTAYTTIMEVLKDGGGACYTLEIRGTGPEATDVQSWTFKSPAGATLATATWRAASEQLTIHCGGVNYVIGDVGCPGTDGQPNDGDDCADDNCER